MKRRRFAISDIHGHLETFKALLKLILLKKKDTLFLIGDYIDRGPNSKAVIDLILQMIAEGYDIRPMAGNHEHFLLQSLSDPGVLALWCVERNGGRDTLASYGIQHYKTTDSPYSAPLVVCEPGWWDKIPKAHLEFLLALPEVIVTSKEVFVHAGLDFKKEDPLVEIDLDSALWERHKQEEYLSYKLDGRRLVTGHTPQMLVDIELDREEGHIIIDGGCFSTWNGCGNLVAFDLDNNQVYHHRNIG